MKYFAVIDTNILVSSLLSSHQDSATVLIRKFVLEGVLVPLFNDEILAEYKAVLLRPKFKFPERVVMDLIDAFIVQGIYADRIHSDELFPDPKDIVFYEVALSKKDAYLVTGNIKHFPQDPIVVTPAEMLKIILENR